MLGRYTTGPSRRVRRIAPARRVVASATPGRKSAAGRRLRDTRDVDWPSAGDAEPRNRGVTLEATAQAAGAIQPQHRGNARPHPQVPRFGWRRPDTTAQRDAQTMKLVSEVSRDWVRSKTQGGREATEAGARYSKTYPEVIRRTIAFYASETTHAWAAITADGTVTTSAPATWPTEMWPDGKDIWLTAESLYALAKQFLDHEGAFFLQIELAAIQGDLLTLMDGKPTEQQARSAFALSRKRIETARSNFRIGALTRATSRYLEGIVIALAVLAPVSLLIGSWVQGRVPGKEAALMATACAIAGMFGALVSVLTRISGRGLDLDYRAGKRMLHVVGFARPVLGAIFASALYFATIGGLVPLKAPDDDAVRFAFFIGIGFIAGFSERYAQDMLSVTPKDDAEPAPAPASAAATA